MIKKIKESLSRVFHKVTSDKVQKREHVNAETEQTKRNLKIHQVKQNAIIHLQNELQYINFIETGTYLGDMVEAQRLNFNRVFSIELSVDLYAKAVKRFEMYPNVQIIQGDSGEVLPTLLMQIKDPAIFWLDGHYSAGVTARGTKECPVYEELHGIFTNQDLQHAILIDDARLFVGENDYPKIDDLRTYIAQQRPDYRVTISEDIIYVLPGNVGYSG